AARATLDLWRSAQAGGWGTLPKLDRRAFPHVGGPLRPRRSFDQAHARPTALPNSLVPSPNRDRAPVRARTARSAPYNSDALAPFPNITPVRAQYSPAHRAWWLVG